MNRLKNPFKIFLVEDDKWYAEILEYNLSLNPDYSVEKYSSGKEFLDNLHKKPDVICLDYSLPDIDGKKVIKKLNEKHSHIPVIMISGQEDVQTAIDVLQEDNVQDYLVKADDTTDRLWKAVIKIREREELVQEVKQLKEELGRQHDFNSVIKGNSSEIKKVFELMQKACSSNITVSITGQTGTGKELVAKCIHFNSSRSKNSFVAVNMTAIPGELLESELFGHEKGAFTGAHVQRIGKFEEAHKGTIFLDEIADMDLNMQAKLLRVLQEKEVTRIGSNKTVKIDSRVIVATHKNLAEEVRNGRFREDLYFRLLGLPIEIPPLKERKDDILIMAESFIQGFCKENGFDTKQLSKEAKSKLLDYQYPGNVRELKAITELAVVMAEGDMITDSDIRFNGITSFTDFIDGEKTLKDYIGNIVKHYLDKHDNDVSVVAEKLDMGKSTIYKMIQRGEV